uniref:Putative secreted protein n=1 Tax=Ixodes ricinus TaxID=34613 RepID=A0A6B0UWR3_IXORI
MKLIHAVRLFTQVTACFQFSAGSAASPGCDSATPLSQATKDGPSCVPAWQPRWTFPQSFKATSSTSPSSFDTNSWRNLRGFSGHGSSIVMKLIHAVRLFTQKPVLLCYLSMCYRKVHMEICSAGTSPEGRKMRGARSRLPWLSRPSRSAEFLMQ